jgi:hypothetical protein
MPTAMEWMRMVRVQKQQIERLNINATFYAIIASDSAKTPSSLSCLSSAPVSCCVASCPPLPQLLVAPPPPVQQHVHSTCLPLIVLLPLVLPLFFSGVVTSCLPRLVVVSPLVMLPSSVHLRLCLLLHHHLSCAPLMHLSRWLSRCLSPYCSQAQQEGKLLQVLRQSLQGAH